MLLFLYGPDTYRSRRKLQEIIEHYKKIHKSGLNLRFFEGDNLSFEDFRDELQQSPMFKEKKLFVIKNSLSNIQFKEKFLENIKKIADSRDIILLYEENEIPQNDLLFKSLKKIGKTQEFKLLEGEKLKNWIKREFENYQVKITPEALNQLIDFVGNNLWQMSNEIKKLVTYKKGHPQATTVVQVCPIEQKIESKDVELLIKPKIETDIFKTIDAIALKNKKRALELLHRHLEKGDNPLYLLSMINFQFRNLLLIKDLIEKHQPYYLIMKKTQLKPFVVKKSYQQANRFTLLEIKKIYQKLFEVDLNIKIGRIDPETALDLLIAEI